MFEKEKIRDIYHSLKKELFIYIFKYTGSQEISEDLLHDCFVNLIKYSEKHEIKDSGIRAFLYKTAHNLCINYLKRSKKFEFSNIDDNPGIDIFSSDTILLQIHADELNEKIYTLLDDVDEVSRSIFIMKKELGVSMAEIADYCDLSERTVRRKLAKLLNNLAVELEKSGFM
jgi:RNA polymerase sigma-70 factor (ECF subfamily)